MNKTLVLECNRNTSEKVYSNADYETQLAKPITVNPGDQISLKLASIDSQKVSDDNIIITDDTQISLTYSFYERNYTLDNKYGANTLLPYTELNYDYYAAYNEYEYVFLESIEVTIVGYHEPYIDTGVPTYLWHGGSFVLAKGQGNPTPDQEFTMTVQYLDDLGRIRTGTLKGSNATKPTSDPFGWRASSDKIKLTPTSRIEFCRGTLVAIGYTGIWSDAKTAPTLGAAIPSSSSEVRATPVNVPVKNSQFKFTEGDISVIALRALTPQLLQKTSSALIPQGTYDRKALAVFMTQLLGGTNGIKPASTNPTFLNQRLTPNNPMLIRADDADYNDSLVMRRIDFQANEGTINFTDTNAYRYNYAVQPISVAIFIGASQFAIEYGSTGNVFSLSYAHTPVLNPAQFGKQNVAIYHTGTTANNNLRYHELRSSSGIVIHDLQPVSFWRDQLGLYDELIVPIQRSTTNDIQYYLQSTMVEKIPLGFSPLSEFFLPPTAGTDPRIVSPIPPHNNPVYIDVTGQTEQVIGKTVNDNANGGYYFIEVIGLPVPRGGLVDTEEENPRIFGIVSKQYNSNSIITGFSDSGITYIHQGTPQMISGLRVRILDPSKQVVQDLGPNNTVFIQLDKALQQQMQQTLESQQTKRGRK